MGSESDPIPFLSSLICVYLRSSAVFFLALWGIGWLRRVRIGLAEDDTPRHFRLFCEAEFAKRERGQSHRPAVAKGRQSIATGVSPWAKTPPQISPEGAEDGTP